jgi:hypothetical protein
LGSSARVWSVMGEGDCEEDFGHRLLLRTYLSSKSQGGRKVHREAHERKFKSSDEDVRKEHMSISILDLQARRQPVSHVLAASITTTHVHFPSPSFTIHARSASMEDTSSHLSPRLLQMDDPCACGTNLKAHGS